MISVVRRPGMAATVPGVDLCRPVTLALVPGLCSAAVFYLQINTKCSMKGYSEHIKYEKTVGWTHRGSLQRSPTPLNWWGGGWLPHLQQRHSRL